MVRDKINQPACPRRVAKSSQRQQAAAHTIVYELAELATPSRLLPRQLVKLHAVDEAERCG